MFESQAKTPWYRSPVLKVAGALILAVAGVISAYKLIGYTRQESHYSELERHREQQRQQAAANPAPVEASTPTPVVPVVPQPPDASAANATQQQPAAVAGNNTAPASSVAAPQREANHPSVAPATRNYWTNFRGPARDGRYDEQAIKTNWPAGGLKPMWKQPVGGGYSSFVVADGSAYTIEQRRGQEVVAAYQAETGRELWTHGWNALFSPDDTGDGPRSTPTWDDGRIYALGAAGELRCLDAKTGKLIWNKNILADNQAQNISWGVAGSPLIVDDKVIVMPGGRAGKSVVAYNKLTGARVWQAMNDAASYTSPALVTLGGKRQVLVVTAGQLAGLEPADGTLLWTYGWPVSMGISVSQPIVVGKNRVFISAGYSKGAALVELSPTGKGFTPRTLWENINLKTKFNSAVYNNGYVYGLDEGILTCIDVETGTRKWKGGRYGYGQVLLASNHLIITTEDGQLALVKADPAQYTEVAKFAALDGKTWNVPALANGRLLVRNANEMACYNLTE